MLVVLDPGFFREEGIDGADEARREEASVRLAKRLDDANLLLRRKGAALIVGVDTFRWFDEIYRAEVRKIVPVAGHRLKSGLDQLRGHAKRGRVLPGVSLEGKMWGVPMMADWPPFDRSYRNELERVLAAAVVAAKSETEVVFLCHRIEGRNVRDRSSGGVELAEVLRWRLAVAVRGAETTLVPCVSNLRQVDVSWTRRMDERLPDVSGPGLHPFCPRDGWRNSKVDVWGTHQSRPCWRDDQGQWWARPGTGGGHHWDVYLNAEHAASIGLAQINVTQHGAPTKQGRPGDLHHVPTEKRHALRRTSGWRCTG
jgi:hypothetical protein